MAKPMTDEQINAFFTDHEALDLYTSIAYRMFESQE